VSVTQTLVGGVVAFGATMALLQSVLPAPQNIVVHSITFDRGHVIQDRTVNSESDHFWATWSASVIGPDGNALEWCIGSGAWPYQSGRKQFPMSLEKWTGADACTLESLPRNVPLKLLATWKWGDEDVTAESATFEVME